MVHQSSQTIAEATTDVERVLLADIECVSRRIGPAFFIFLKKVTSLLLFCAAQFTVQAREKKEVGSLVNQSNEGGDMAHQSVPGIAEAATDVERVLLGDV